MLSYLIVTKSKSFKALTWKVSITNVVLENLPQNHDNFLKYLLIAFTKPNLSSNYIFVCSYMNII